jgi:hypothetical protein
VLPEGVEAHSEGVRVADAELRAFLGLEHPEQRLDDRRLPRPRPSDDCHLFAGADLEGDVLENQGQFGVVPSREVLEL